MYNHNAVNGVINKVYLLIYCMCKYNFVSFKNCKILLAHECININN